MCEDTFVVNHFEVKLLKGCVKPKAKPAQMNQKLPKEFLK